MKGAREKEARRLPPLIQLPYLTRLLEGNGRAWQRKLNLRHELVALRMRWDTNGDSLHSIAESRLDSELVRSELLPLTQLLP